MTPQTLERSETKKRNIYFGLLHEIWLAHENKFNWFAAIWLIGLWVLMIFSHPTWMLVFGSVFALTAGTSLGGMDTIPGCEEITFSLPPTREQHYLMRAGVGITILLAFVLIGLAAIRHDLPQMMWGMIVDSGFTKPFPYVERPLLYYPLAITVPAGLFSWTFIIATGAQSPRLARHSWLLGVFWKAIFTAATYGVMYWYAGSRWSDQDAFLFNIILFGLSVIILTVGFFLYRQKEGIVQSETGNENRNALLWTLITILLVIVFYTFRSIFI